MLAAVVISFFVCLLPFRGLTLWIIIAPAEDILALGVEKYYNILYFSRIMLYLNSAMNPILYNLMSSKFREGFFRLLGCRSLVARKKFIHGAHKGTFHTTSTNLSSSQSNDRRINHKQQQQYCGSSGYNGSFTSSNRKRMSETFEDSCQLPNEYLIENGKLTNGRKKNNFLIKKCLVESTVINAIAHEPAANRDLSRRLKENLTEPCSEFTSEIESLMDGEGVEEDVLVGRQNTKNLLRRPSRQFEFNNNNCRENRKGDMIVVLIKPVTPSTINEESNSLDDGGSPDMDTNGGVEEGPVAINGHDECQRVRQNMPEERRLRGPQLPEKVDTEVLEFDLTEAVFLAAKESIV